jgi:hypothetical protein
MILAISTAISSGERIRSMHPLAMALDGISACPAVSGLCAMVTPLRAGRQKRRVGHNLALRLRDHKVAVLRFRRADRQCFRLCPQRPGTTTAVNGQPRRFEIELWTTLCSLLRHDLDLAGYRRRAATMAGPAYALC